jgi:predicted HTH transcriptional regulator
VNQGSLQKLVNNFVDQLHDLWKQEIVDALGGKVGSLKNGNGVGYGRGVKRAPADLDRLADRFVDFVKTNPHLRIEQINKQLGTTTKELMLPIRKLIAEGRLKADGQKRSTTYAVPGEKKPADKKPKKR